MSDVAAVECTHCGKRLRLTRSLLEKSVPCPQCKQPFIAVEMALEIRESAGSSGLSLAAIFGIGLAAVGLIACIGLFAARSSPTKGGASAKSVARPVEEFAWYNAEDAAFRCEYPADWNVSSGGASGSAWVTFRRGSTYIKVSEKILGNLLGDVAGNLTDDDGEFSAVEGVHAAQRQYYAEEEFGNYIEEPSAAMKCDFGKARRSFFAASGSWGKKIKGLRVTALGAVRQIDLLCVCPASDFDVLRPAFERVAESLAVGRRK